jgi:hypothetical protein
MTFLKGERFLSGASRTRTGDLLDANQTLSQLSYGPEEPSVALDWRSFPLASLV